MIISSSPTRLNWIDYAKGLGIILVVYGHVLRGLNNAKLINPTFFHYSDNVVYSFHMPLFFILSGYFFYSSFIKRSQKDFLVNKLQVLMYLFVIWSLIQTGIEVRLSRYTHLHLHSDVLLSCLYKPRSQFWFVYALFFMNILSVMFFSISKKAGFMLSVALWLLYCFFPVLLSPFDRIFINFIYFTAGIALSLYHKPLKLILTNAWVCIANVLVFSVALYAYFNYPKDSWYNELFPQLSGCCVVFYLCNWLSESKKLFALEYLGINSLTIYLLHMLAGNGTRIVLLNFLHINNAFVHVVVATLVGLAVPLGVYKIAMNTRYLSWLFKYPSYFRLTRRKVMAATIALNDDTASAELVNLEPQ